MKLFYSPLACSLATRITLDELGLDAEYVPIDHATRRPADGREIHPLGMVPVLVTDDGKHLTENAAILTFVAEGTALVPSDPWERVLLTKWLSFVGTELHKAVFAPLLDRKSNDGAKSYALANAAPRLSLLERHLAGRDFLLARYSVADIYLATVLNWSRATPVRIDDYPEVARYAKALWSREHFARRIAREREEYVREHGTAVTTKPVSARDA